MAQTHLAGHLVPMEILQTFLLLLFLTHADPGVCDDGVGTVHRLQWVVGDGELRAALQQPKVSMTIIHNIRST